MRRALSVPPSGASLPSFEMLPPKNLRSSGHGTALFVSLNRIKEAQGDLFADRTSAATMRANQLRLRFASMASALLCALRRRQYWCNFLLENGAERVGAPPFARFFLWRRQAGILFDAIGC